MYEGQDLGTPTGRATHATRTGRQTTGRHECEMDCMSRRNEHTSVTGHRQVAQSRDRATRADPEGELSGLSGLLDTVLGSTCRRRSGGARMEGCHMCVQHAHVEPPVYCSPLYVRVSRAGPAYRATAVNLLPVGGCTDDKRTLSWLVGSGVNTDLTVALRLLLRLSKVKSPSGAPEYVDILACASVGGRAIKAAALLALALRRLRNT